MTSATQFSSFWLLTCLLQFSTPLPGYNSSEYIQVNDIIEDTIKNPTVNLEELAVGPLQILVIRDTARKVEEISSVFRRDYGELFAFISKNGLIPKKVMAFYYSSSLPFLIDVAVEVNKIPDSLSGRIQSKYLEGGDAVIAKYKGPYDRIAIAYTAISDWLIKQKKQRKDKPFEVYLNDPLEVKDPFELRTDVYQLIK